MKNFAITITALLLTSILFISNANAQLWSGTTSNPFYSYIKANTDDYRGVLIGGSIEPITGNPMLSIVGDTNRDGIACYGETFGITAITNTGVALRAEANTGGLAGDFLGNVDVNGQLAASDMLTSRLQVGLINSTTTSVLFSQNPNGGLAAHFDGDVKVENGHVVIGDDMNLTGGLDALLQVKTSAPQTFGIRAESTHTIAVTGASTNAAGVSGGSVNGRGVYGSSVESNAIEGHSINGIGVYGASDNDLAGRFDGDVKINGIAEISTAHGAVTIGAINPWNTHFYTSSPQYYFNTKVKINGQVSATALNITSDKRLKKDVRSFEYGLDEVLQLNPLTYDYTGKGGTKSGDYNVGLFAQDLQKVAPEFVTEFTHRERNDKGEVNDNGKDYLQIYDTGIKYMLINATSSLEQNQPNPFSTNTLIKYELPKDANNAVITIYNTNGQVMHQERIARGTGEIQLQANSLNSGTYSYTLTVDGRIVDTKQMVVTK